MGRMHKTRSEARFSSSGIKLPYQYEDRDLYRIVLLNVIARGQLLNQLRSIRGEQYNTSVCLIKPVIDHYVTVTSRLVRLGIGASLLRSLGLLDISGFGWIRA